MASADSGSMLADMAEVLRRDMGDPFDGILVHSELQPGVISTAVFKDRGADVFYHEASRDLDNLIRDLWYMTDPKRRWAEIEYRVRDGRFEATFAYPEEIDPEEDDFDRRDRIVHRHFGDKPIAYPPADYYDRNTFSL